MDMDLKKGLVNKLNEIAPEYGLVELTYPSFMRCFGYHSQPLSAADAVEGVVALLDVASGVRMEVEVEGARNGGEWFGASKLWEGPSGRRRRDDERENVRPGGRVSGTKVKPARDGVDGDELGAGQSEVEWWIKNFWDAYDALSE